MRLLNPALRGFYETKGVRNYVLYGGRASSKTYHTAAFCVFLAMTHRVKFLCVRQFQNRISDSVKAVIEETIFRMGREGEFVITESGISYPKTGSTFSFYGIQRHLKEIKGFVGAEILWIEEAEDLTKDQWKVLEPTVRADHSRVFIVFNPRYATDYVYENFVTNPSSDTLTREINYDENPFLSQTMLDVIARERRDDPDTYQHIYRGVPRDNDEGVIIKRAWILAAIGAAEALGFEPSGEHRIGFDIADDGADKCATIAAHGSHVQGADMWQGQADELLKSCTRAWNAAVEINAFLSWDSIGVGATAGAKFNELNAAHPTGRPVMHVGFNAGGKVYRPEAEYMPRKKNQDMFSNIKAQAWWLVADRLLNTFVAMRELAEGKACRFAEDELIFIDPKLPHLKLLTRELSTPRRDYDQNGKVKVESKADLAKPNRPGGPQPSPNLADAFIMAFAPGQRPMTIDPSILTGPSRFAM